MSAGGLAGQLLPSAGTARTGGKTASALGAEGTRKGAAKGHVLGRAHTRLQKSCGTRARATQALLLPAQSAAGALPSSSSFRCAPLDDSSALSFGNDECPPPPQKKATTTTTTRTTQTAVRSFSRLVCFGVPLRARERVPSCGLASGVKQLSPCVSPHRVPATLRGPPPGSARRDGTLPPPPSPLACHPRAPLRPAASPPLPALLPHKHQRMPQAGLSAPMIIPSCTSRVLSLFPSARPAALSSFGPPSSMHALAGKHPGGAATLSTLPRDLLFCMHSLHSRPA